MDQFRLLCLLSLFYVASVVVGNGYANKVDDGESWISYWNSALPKSPLPSKAVQQLLNLAEGEKSYTGIGKDAVSLTPFSVNTYSRTTYAASAAEVKVEQGERSPTGIGKDAVSLTRNGINTYSRTGYAASGEEVKVEPGLTTFFQGNDLQQLGKKVTLRFLKTTSNKAILLPRQLVKSIPFSSRKFPEILTYYRVKPKSAIAETMKRTITVCEAPPVKGEEKYCATSLESLIDFTVSKIGKHVQVYATEAETENESKQEYTIETTGVKSIGDRSIVCHKQNYVYGVFYCHQFYGTTTKAYMVPLVGADGVTKAKAVAVCHTDTTGWNPKHLAFRVLKIKPGNTIPVESVVVGVRYANMVGDRKSWTSYSNSLSKTLYCLQKLYSNFLNCRGHRVDFFFLLVSNSQNNTSTALLIEQSKTTQLSIIRKENDYARTRLLPQS